jgi:hypothetical protein
MENLTVMSTPTHVTNYNQNTVDVSDALRQVGIYLATFLLG